MARIRAPTKKLPYEDIQGRVEAFLRDHGRYEALPIEVEELVEVDLGIDVVPVEDLQELQGECCLSGDLTTIYIDRAVYHHRVPHRLRSSLAHELGHIALHRELFEGLGLQSVEERKTFFQEVDQDDYFWLEKQAYNFAGCLLAPPEHLRQHFELELGEKAASIREAKGLGLSPEEYRDYVTELPIDRLKPVFCTSSGTLRRRIRKDGLTDLIS
jgi:hypothetical protein